MHATRYRAPPAGALLIEPLDEIIAVFHRTSGITHLLAADVADLLAALSPPGLTIAELESAFAVEGDRAGLEAMLADLAVAGLVERV
jgi:PqqD family protein of HPr-rel-A system